MRNRAKYEHWCGYWSNINKPPLAFHHISDTVTQMMQWLDVKLEAENISCRSKGFDSPPYFKGYYTLRDDLLRLGLSTRFVVSEVTCYGNRCPIAVLGQVVSHMRAQNRKTPQTDPSVFCKKAFSFTEGPDAQPRVHKGIPLCSRALLSQKLFKALQSELYKIL